jgi:hypothetical protein
MGVPLRQDLMGLGQKKYVNVSVYERKTLECDIHKPEWELLSNLATGVKLATKRQQISPNGRGGAMERKTVMWFEMTPDIYGGEKCDEHIPRWNGYAAGDKQDDTTRQPLTFDPKNFPPGTKITVEEPLCPKCGEIYENCMARGSGDACDFDWRSWAEELYS